jgi:Coenzyme PQQ synthesis protein D (PqqD)
MGNPDGPGGTLIHASEIVHETLDGETIAIHLVTGNYYSLTGSGAEIWDLLALGGSIPEICSELARRHECGVGELRDTVESFIADLEREGLVQDGDASLNADPRSEATGPVGPWEPPKLDRYDDMRDFLLVDPIHEVDRTGWPAQKKSH